MSEQLQTLEEKSADAVLKAIDSGNWLNSPLATYVFEKGLEGLKRRAEEAQQSQATRADATDIDDQGWIDESWAAWRLVLRTGDNPSVVFFSREPTYAERKAFAAAAKVPVVDAVAEERPQ